MTPVLNAVPLVEFGSPVTMAFRGRQVPAFSDPASGYVFFDPPPEEELTEYYQVEYPRSQTGYYTVDTDYEPSKNDYHAGRILRAFQDLTGREPASSFELGCAYGGLVAEMASRGIDARGSDINADAVAQGTLAKGNHRIFHAANRDALDRVGASFDLIYSVHTLEHDPQMFDVIRACRDKLNEDGLLFVAVPNAMFANAVLKGFRENWWAHYPQHLHMLSPGFIPALCRATGFAPLFWDTQIVFEAQPDVLGLLNKDETTDARRDLWRMLLSQGGHGMELNFVLAPAGGAMARRLAGTVAMVEGALEHARRNEARLRHYLRLIRR